MKHLPILALVIVLQGCNTIDGLLPASQAQVDKIRKESLEDRKNLSSLANQVAPGSPAAIRASIAVDEYSIQSSNPYAQWINHGIGALVALMGGGGLYGGAKLRQRWKQEDPNKDKS